MVGEGPWKEKKRPLLCTWHTLPLALHGSTHVLLEPRQSVKHIITRFPSCLISCLRRSHPQMSVAVEKSEDYSPRRLGIASFWLIRLNCVPQKPPNLEIRPFTPALPGFPCQIFIEAETLYGHPQADGHGRKQASKAAEGPFHRQGLETYPLFKSLLISQEVEFYRLTTLMHFRKVELAGG